MGFQAQDSSDTQRNKTVGYRRILDELFRQYNVVVNHKRVLRLMQELAIKANIRRKYIYRSSHEAAVSDWRIAEFTIPRFQA
jgi:putative transposase